MFLVWCDVELGDDKAASIDKQTRADLRAKLEEHMAQDEFKALGEKSGEKVHCKRLVGMLVTIDEIMGSQYPAQMRKFHFEQVRGWWECAVCYDEEDDEEGVALQQCSICKGVKYCSAKCQKKAWKEHKLLCYQAAF